MKILYLYIIFVILTITGIGYHATHRLTVSTEVESNLTFEYKENKLMSIFNGYTYNGGGIGDPSGATNSDGYSYAQTKDGGINYFHNDTPITNTEFSNALGINTNLLESKDPNIGMSASGAYFKPVDTNNNVLNNTSIGGGSSTGSSVDTQTQSYNRDYLNAQAQQLRDLLGRIATGETQGLQKNQRAYDKQLSLSNADNTAQMAEYGDQETKQGLGKEKSFNEANRNAGNSYRSLSQILGRAGGTGSSAFRELLPDAIGKGLNENRQSTIENYGENMQGIGKARNKYQTSFEEVLADLLDQKQANEESLRSGVESQRQNVYSQQATNQGQLVQNENPNASFSAIQAAQNPYKQAIDNSLNTVEGFFNKYNTPFTPKAAVKEAPALSEFTTDRAAINAQNQGMDSSNPYAGILRKRILQEQG